MPGNVEFRALQVGLQSVFGTPVAATRRVGLRFNPTWDPHWTYPDVDTGTLDPAIAPYRMADDITGEITGPLGANDAAWLFSTMLKGGIVPTGPTDSAYTWLIEPDAEAADDYDVFTAEWGDETADQFRYQDGIIDSMTLTWPQDLGPIQVSAQARFGSGTYPQARTGSLAVENDPPWLYGADTMLYINDTAGTIGITPIMDSMHDASIQFSSNTDVKRFSNGSNANFQVAGYGRGRRGMQTTFNFAKSTPALAEAVKWLNANPQERFIQLDVNGRSVIGAAAHPSMRIRFAGFWFTRSEQAVGSNSAFQLVCQHFYDPDLSVPISVRIVNELATLMAATP